MNKILITGLQIGTDAGICQACNYDFNWIIQYPSTFIWADKIIVPKSIWDVIQKERYPDSKEIAKCLKLILEIAHSCGIVEVAELPDFLRGEFGQSIFSQIDRDLEDIKRLFPGKVDVKDISKKGTNEITETIIEGEGFCPASLWTIYASLVLARIWNANCLFDSRSLHYLRYKFGITAFPMEADPGLAKSFANVFEAYIPNENIIPEYALHSQGQCKSCKKENQCNDSYLVDFEKQVKQLLSWHEYDEIQQAKEVINTIINERDNDNSFIDDKEVVQAFKDKQEKIRKRIRSVFPKIKRWANIATILSIPLSTTGYSTNSPLITLAGMSAFGLAQVGQKYIQYLESKNKWVSFLQNMTAPCKKTQKKVKDSL